MFTRRQTFAGAALLGFPSIARATSWFATTPFTLGVTSGDPAPDGFVIWTRLAPAPYDPRGGMPPSAVTVAWEVAEDEQFAKIAARGHELARPELAHSVHVEVTGLKPDRPYWYRFAVGDQQSLPGQARTLPAPGAAAAVLRFGVCGCQHYEAGYYTAFRHLAHEDLAFVFHYGDFLYEYTYDNNVGPDGLVAPKVRSHRQAAIYSLDDYRAQYAQYLSDLDLQASRMRHTFLSTFDDHEIENNWTGAGDISQDPSVPPEIFALRRAVAMQAWYEHMPVRRALLPQGELIHMNRRVAYGGLAAINLLDTRSFRTDQPCGDGFKPACPAVYDPNAQMMGAAQEAWLDANLAKRDTIWNCVAQQVMMMTLDRRTGNEPEKIINLDDWVAYDAPRKRLMKRLAGVENAVVITGDEHQNFAGLLLDGDKPVAGECVLTSITSGGDGSDLRPGSDRIMAENAQLKFINDQRGYGVCEVTPEAWHTHFMVVDRVSTPGGALSRRATATIPRGSASLEIA